MLNPYATRPGDLKPGDQLGYICVAVVGDAGDWSAYYGLTDQTAEEVASNGDKMGRLAAEALFPVCRLLTWRN